MASASGSGGSGGDRRYPANLQGLLQFATEHTKTEDARGAPTYAQMDPECLERSSRSKTQSLSSSGENDPELARINQDNALKVLGLHRYRIAGDGNCLFRAVAWQLKLDQEEYHPVLRKASAKWMKEHKTELMDWGLLDDGKEISETEKLGVWPGQAAIIALSNILQMNIAVVQGGDKGDIDIQHISPFMTDSQTDDGSLIVAYLYNGHYDAIVEQPDLENPDFEAWSLRCKTDMDASEALARQLAEEEMYGRDGLDVFQESLPETVTGRVTRVEAVSSESPAISSLIPGKPYTEVPSVGLKHKAELPLVPGRPYTEVPRDSTIKHKTEVPKISGKPYAEVPREPGKQKMDVAKVSSKPYTEVSRSHGKPARPGQAADSDRNRHSHPEIPHDTSLKVTFYPRVPVEPQTATNSHRHREAELKVTRKEPTKNLLQERQGVVRSPTIRVIPIQYLSRSQSLEGSESGSHRSAVRRKDYVPKATITSVGAPTIREPLRHSGGSYSSNPNYHGDPARGYVTTVYHTPGRSERDHRSGSQTLPRSRSREVPILVLSAKSPEQRRKGELRDTMTYNLNHPFEFPQELRPYRGERSEVKALLSQNSWIFE